LREALRPIAEPGGATALASLLSDAFIPPPSACVDVRVCGANTNSREIVS
jgi:threonine dehydratase